MWRKHIYVLIKSTGTQILQLLLTLVFVLFVAPVLRNHFGVPLNLRLELSLALILFCIWTAIHLTREAGVQPPTATDATSALARRQALLTRLSAPWKRIIATISILLALGLSAGTIVLNFAAPGWVWLFIVLYYGFLLTWLGIEVVDWYNDQYILTEDRIIDIMRLPIIYEQRTEAPLAMVQNATTSQKGIGVILDFGNVQVETAGQSRAILFENVWKPREIQEEIFRQMDALDQANRRRDHEAQVTQTQRWFEAYHTMASGIRDIQYDETVSGNQSIHIRWKIQGLPSRGYRTWMDWDVVSHANGGQYAERLRPHGQLWYTDNQQVDGIASGMHHIRGFMTPPGYHTIYFRINAWFEGAQPAQSSPELTIVVR